MTDKATTDTQKGRTRKRRTRRRRARRDEVVYYVVAIEDWDWSFLFMAGDRVRSSDRRYEEYRHLHIFGSLIRPSKMKAESVELTFLPDHRHDERDTRPAASMVGSVDYRRSRFTALLTMPMDVLPPILQMLIAGKFRFVVISGARPHYGHAAVASYRFEMKIDEDDLPPDE